MFKLDIEKAKEPEIKLTTFTGSSKAREFQKNIYFWFTYYAKAFDCVDNNKRENSLRDGNTRPPDLPLRNLYAGKKQQLKLDIEKQSDSQLGKEYVKAIYCHPAYLTYIQST